MSKKHRIVMIGHGMISHAYLQAFRAHENAEIVGVVGRDSERVRAYANEHQIPVFGTDLADVAKRAQATAAVICTPNALHDEGVIKASRLGLHCLCEKPLHISPERQRVMIESCRTNQVKLAVSYMRRFIPHMQYIKELIESGKLGRITVADVKIKHFRAKEYYDSWHGTETIDGGGPFIQQGSHIIDLMLWLCGGYQQVIEAARFQVYHDIETEDHGYAIVQYKNGAVGMISASTASVGMSEEAIEISGTEGSISANYERIVHFDVPGVEPPTFTESESANETLFYRLVDDFLRAIDEDGTPFIDGEAAALATEFIQEIYAKAGKPVRTFSS